MKKIFILILSLFLLTGCDLIKSDALKDIDVYTTTYPVNYIIDYLYGDNANIYSIYPNGVNFKAINCPSIGSATTGIIALAVSIAI